MNQTTIVITIRPELTHKTEAERSRQQIEVVSQLISALFWTLRKNAEGFDLLDLATQKEHFDFVDYRNTAQLICLIGEALSSELTILVLQAGDKNEK